MKKYLMRWLFLVGLCWSSPLLYGQSTLESLQQVQFLSQNVCVVVQVNADDIVEEIKKEIDNIMLRRFQ